MNMPLAPNMDAYLQERCFSHKTRPIDKIVIQPGSDPTQMGSDGTAFGEGASAAAEKAITGRKSDNDPAGTKYNKLQLRSSSQTSTSITLLWTKPSKAAKVSRTRTLKVHRSVRYESSNKKIATVTSKGTIKGVRKGTCYIYAYAQNGVARKIKVTVN